jgi:putative solute:sodium symporter small subunit
MPDKQEGGKASAYWRRTRRLSFMLLAVWFGISFIAIFFARELAQIRLFGWSVSFYLAAQGALLAYLAIIGIYAVRMRRLDEEAHGDQHGG